MTIKEENCPECFGTGYKNGLDHTKSCSNCRGEGKIKKSISSYGEKIHFDPWLISTSLYNISSR